jgi:hypothetical protein
LRTARGAGRLLLEDLVREEGRAPERVLVPLRVLRDRELEDVVRDVLLLRDPGGEDVRVAMV